MRRAGLLLGLAMTMSGCACAQEEPVHTLRVFANLIQVPTLVLDEVGRPVEERTHPKFLVRLDGGKPFVPTHVRLEGEDPILLTVLLDASGADDELFLFVIPEGNLRLLLPGLGYFR